MSESNSQQSRARPQATRARASGSALGLVTIASGVGAAGGMALGLIEGLVAVSAGGLAVLPLALCLYGPLGLLVGLLLGTVAAGVADAGLAPGHSSILDRLRVDEQWDRSVAAWLVATGCWVVVEVLLVQGFARGPAAAMANPRLAGLCTGLVAGAGLVVGAALFFPLRSAAARAVRLVPRSRAMPATVVLCALALLAAVAGGLVVLGTVDWRVLRFGPWVMLGLLGLLTSVGIWLLWRRVAGHPPQRPWRAAGLTLLVGVGLALAAPAAGRSERAVAAIQQEGWLLPLLVDVGRALGDSDGDGYSRWFGGGDCDDSDPSIHPGAHDVPGDGIDQNCSGGDAQPASRPAVRPKTAASSATRPAFGGNVLLVCVDTLRNDSLDHPENLTPNIARLAARGVRFNRAFAQGANTPQSFPSIFTSRYPTRVPFRKRLVGYPPLDDAALTFFEVLRDAGVATAAVSSHFYFTPERGITQGVEDWDNRDAKSIKDSNADVSAPRIVPRAIAKLGQLKAQGRRFVLFVHLFEPHSTYVKHPEYPITRRGTAGLKQRYDYEVKFVDVWLGKLLAGLAATGLEDSTAVLLFSDHGEAFGEHKLYFHGQTLYNEVLHVPLVIVVPGVITRSRVVDRPVALLDIAPTILDLFSVPIPDSFQGYSLLPLGLGEPGDAPADRRIGAVLMPYPAWPKAQQAMIAGRYKAILRTTENRFEAYDLQTDPGEQRNLVLTDPPLAARLRTELRRFAEQELLQRP